jgi:site-specific recombinase XerD
MNYSISYLHALVKKSTNQATETQFVESLSNSINTSIVIYQKRHSFLKITSDGKKWVYTFREKTDEKSNIPLLPKALKIIEKYKNDPRGINKGKLLPVISNMKTNAYLKEIANVCGIKKNLTFHMARHTFATTITLTNGVPIETVSNMLGHSKITTTQIYAKVLENKVSADMNLLEQKLSGL